MAVTKSIHNGYEIIDLGNDFRIKPSERFAVSGHPFKGANFSTVEDARQCAEQREVGPYRVPPFGACSE